MLVYLNGEYLPNQEAKVSVDDRGFIFGDGVYEVIRALGGRFFTADEHLARMEHGMHALRIPQLPETRSDALLAVAQRLLDENELSDGEATVYMQVTRGSARRTHYFPPVGTPPTVYLATSRFAPPVELRGSGADAVTCPDVRWSRCNLKTINLLPNVLAKQQAVEAGAVEAVLVRNGVVTEGASTNVFGVIDGELRTHPTSDHILPGITRAVIIGLAEALGYPVVQRPIAIEEVAQLEELFLTGTTTDVLPVVRLDGRPVADGRPGPITVALQGALRERMSASTS